MGGGSLARFKAETTLETLHKWKAHCELELSETTRIEYYLAEIIHRLFEIPFAVWGKSSNISPDKHIIKFERKQKLNNEHESEKEETIKEQMETSKQIWKSILARAAESPMQQNKNGINPSEGYISQMNIP